MQLDDHLTRVQDALTAAAALGDERTQQIASALTIAAVPAVRLALLDAIFAVADEITGQLLDHAGAPVVRVTLAGDELAVAVADTDAAPATEVPRDDGDASARISLRLSETLKAEIDRAASDAGASVNTWLVRAAGAAVAAAGARAGESGGPRGRGRGRRDDHRVTGWING